VFYRLRALANTTAARTALIASEKIRLLDALRHSTRVTRGATHTTGPILRLHANIRRSAPHCSHPMAVSADFRTCGVALVSSTLNRVMTVSAPLLRPAFWRPRRAYISWIARITN